jgi:predicted DNA-binding transcriptional regulator AlpA
MTTKLMIRLGPGAHAARFIEAIDLATDSAALVLLNRDDSAGAVDVETDDAMMMIATVLDVASAHDVEVLSVDELVTASEIAARASVSRGAITNFVSGVRGPGGFPRAINPGARNEVYRWAEVSAWLNRTAPDDAQAIAAIDTAVRLSAQLAHLSTAARNRLVSFGADRFDKLVGL